MKVSNDAKKGFLFSIIFHIFCCGLAGFIALTAFHSIPDEPVYDVGLVSGGGDAAPEIAQTKPEPEIEEVVKPKEDDIVEKRETPVPQKKQTVQAPTSNAKHTAPGGTGTGSSPGKNQGQGEGKGQGIGPAGDGIQAAAVPPRVTRSRMPSYPGAARSKGITGTAVVRFLVGKNGGVESVTLARSSGDSSLDQAALSAAGGFKFKPGLDSYGRPIRCYAYQPFAFRL